MTYYCHLLGSCGKNANLQCLEREWYHLEFCNAQPEQNMGQPRITRQQVSKMTEYGDWSQVAWVKSLALTIPRW